MKEFGVMFDEGLRQGVRPFSTNPRNAQSLITCFNLKPDEMGLRPYQPITNPLSGVSDDWPFPQLFLGQDVRVLATATAIYELTNWTLGAAKLTVTENERWELIDFGSHIILTNGTKLCIRDYAGAWTSNNYTTNIPRFSTGCNFNGQVVAGNIKTTWHDCGTGSIIWSKIGSVNFTPDGSNEAGFRNIPWEGDVLKVKKLGKGVVVYCENGILVLVPFQQTFGMETLAAVGIPCKSAVGGNDNIHVFVDNDDNLWRLNKDFNLQLLGYREYMSLMTAANIVVEHDPLKREFHISDDSYGYLLTEKGLCQCYQEVTTVAVDNGVSYGVFDDEEDAEGRIVTDIIDFGQRGNKTIELVEIGGYSASPIAVAADWRSNIAGSFTRSPSSPVNYNGAATVKVTAAEFRVAVTFDDYSDASLDYLHIRYKLSDRRFVRGAYNVNQNAAR